MKIKTSRFQSRGPHPPRAVAESASKSLQYWSTGNGDDTMITLWNPADEAQDLVFKLIFAGGHYLLPIHLNARATRMINVSEIIMSGVPDAEGNTIPPNVHEGSAKIIGSLAENQHILIAMDAGVYNVRKATCGMICYTCDGFSNYTVSPSSFTIDIDGTTVLALVADYDDGFQYDLSGDATWETNNSSIATTDANLVTGEAGGSVIITAIDDFDPIYTPDICYEAGWPDPCPVAVGFAAEATGAVDDSTPVVTGIDPSDWQADGTPQQVTFSGQNFGSNAPTLTFTPSNGISYSLVPSEYNDTQIVANVTVATGTPNETVSVTVTNNGYGNSPFIGGPGQSAKSSPAQAHVHAPMSSPEVTVIGWIDATASDLVSLPTGANATLISDLNSKTGCVYDVLAWSVLQIATDIQTQNDRDYANAWMIKNSPNSPPPSTLAPGSFSSNPFNFRLFNDWGGASGGGGAAGATPDPCGFLGTKINGWLAPGQPSQNMGTQGTSASGQVYQVAEGRVGTMGQRGSQTINQGRTVPWIYAVIEFDSAGNPTVSDHTTFPTFYVYLNGTLHPELTSHQSTVKAFVYGYDASNEGAWSPVP